MANLNKVRQTLAPMLHNVTVTFDVTPDWWAHGRGELGRVGALFERLCLAVPSSEVTANIHGVYVRVLVPDDVSAGALKKMSEEIVEKVRT